MQDEVKVTQEVRALIEAIINDYHTTRLDSDYVPHILSKPRTRDAFAAFARHQAEQRGGEVVAWMYEGPAMLEDGTIIQDRKCFPLRQAYMPSGWTETPLYARLTPLGLAVRATLQEQDHG